MITAWFYFEDTLWFVSPDEEAGGYIVVFVSKVARSAGGPGRYCFGVIRGFDFPWPEFAWGAPSRRLDWHDNLAARA